MDKIKKTSSITVRVSFEAKTGIARLSKDMKLDQSEIVRRLVQAALCSAAKGDLESLISSQLP